MTTQKVIWDIGGRGGSATYEDHRTSFYFPWEVGNAGFELEIPSAENWEFRTGLPLSERDETLRLFGEAGLRRYGENRHDWKILESNYPILLIFEK